MGGLYNTFGSYYELNLTSSMFSASKNRMLLLKIVSFRVLLSLSECPVCLLEFLVALFRLACHCLIFLYG